MAGKWLVVFSLIPGLAACGDSAGVHPENSPKEGAQTLAEELSQPWEIEFSANAVYVTERDGKIVKIGDGRQSRQSVSLRRPVVQEGEGGLLGLALEPDFEQSRRAYVYHTYREGSRLFNRVAMIEETDRGWKEVRVLIERIPGAFTHNGGRIGIGPDGKLYVTTGDAEESANAQDPASLAGKILRLEPDGRIPADNPFPGSPVYSLGHRNPQGLGWQADGSLISSEHGPSGNARGSGQDELNRIEPGKNYGWPLVSGDGTGEGFEPPLIHSGDDTWAPSGIAVTDNNVYVACLRGKQVRVFDLEKRTSKAVLDGVGRVRDVAVRDGYLYVLTNNTDGRGISRKGDDRLIRVKLPA